VYCRLKAVFYLIEWLLLYPASGYRSSTAGAFEGPGSNGHYRSCALSGTGSYYLNLYDATVNPSNTAANRGSSYAVRCVQNLFVLLRFVCSLT